MALVEPVRASSGSTAMLRASVAGLDRYPQTALSAAPGGLARVDPRAALRGARSTVE